MFWLCLWVFCWGYFYLCWSGILTCDVSFLFCVWYLCLISLPWLKWLHRVSLRAFLSLQILEEFEMDSCYIFSKCLIEFTCEDTDPGAVCSVQFSSVAQSCPTFCDPMNCSTPGLPVHHHLPEFIQTQVHRVSDAIQPSHPLSSPSPPAPNPSQHHGLFQWVNSSHEVAKVLEFQL